MQLHQQRFLQRASGASLRTNLCNWQVSVPLIHFIELATSTDESRPRKAQVTGRASTCTGERVSETSFHFNPS